jgi:hypothetical protein
VAAISQSEASCRILLDIRELTERMDNSIKFLSGMFDARSTAWPRRASAYPITGTW